MLAANARAAGRGGRRPARAARPRPALAAAGMTWEDVLSLAGSTVDKAALWTALIPSMGYMALLRNLRNFDEAGVPDEVAAQGRGPAGRPGPGGARRASSRSGSWRRTGSGAVAALGPRAGAGAARVAGERAGAAGPDADPGRPVRLDVRPARRAHSDLTRADVAKVFGAALALRTEPDAGRGSTTASGQVDVPKGGRCCSWSSRSRARAAAPTPARRCGGGTTATTGS